MGRIRKSSNFGPMLVKQTIFALVRPPPLPPPLGPGFNKRTVTMLRLYEIIV